MQIMLRAVSNADIIPQFDLNSIPVELNTIHLNQITDTYGSRHFCIKVFFSNKKIKFSEPTFPIVAFFNLKI
ncbi:hypothetical protein BpHYR1_029219 [Brachionus plicatilis]|uniref:Uncharacterized protein n=1 Tax=Brachionus plicatilis TaxID=10195 RepID=A0A3M7S4B7_BRAPC|nr:hypothetical protein BpHYR1_029219 [Brachionus plicatilis]